MGLDAKIRNRKRCVAVVGTYRGFRFWVDQMQGGKLNTTHNIYTTYKTEYRFIDVGDTSLDRLSALILDDWIELYGRPIPNELLEIIRVRVLQSEV